MKTIEKIIQSATPPLRNDVLWLDISDVKEPQLRFYVNGKWEIASSEAEEVKAILDSIGHANGIASLDGAGLVPASQLPSYVDDVIEVADYAHLPETGESGKIYVTIDNGKTYRWSGSMYIPINEDVIANLAFPDSWHKDGSMAQLISDINNDITAVTGKMYISTVSITDLPASLVQAEMQVDIMASESYGKVILFTITSNDVHPYHWEYTSAWGATGSWHSFLDNSDITGKADKVTSGTENNFAALDANGNIKDSGSKASDFLTQHQDISGKADKVSSPTNGNFAGLDSNGNLTDSGSKASDFATASDFSTLSNKVNVIDEVTAVALNDLEENKEEKSNKVTSISQDSTDEEYPSAKAVYNSIKELVDSEIDMLSYGVEWEAGQQNPVCSRIGNPLFHKTLPVQSQMRGCVANGGVVNYYLYPTNWAYKEDGVTASDLTGADGAVRVETPKFYGKSFANGNKRSVRISTYKIDPTWTEIPSMLVDAYRPTLDRSSGTYKAMSVVNTTPNFRGGGNRSDYDTYLGTNQFRTDLGKPATAIPRSTMRTYAAAADSENMCYEYYKWILYWLFVIEYATFNSQDTYNSTLDANGYHQGGLGAGVTTANGTYWSIFNEYYPLIPNGFTNSLGNFTGVVNTGDVKFTLEGDTTLGVDAFDIKTANCTATKDTTNHTVTITNVTNANTDLLTHDMQHELGYINYTVSGLDSGQSLEFYEGSTKVADIAADGTVSVHWDTTNLGTRSIRATFTGACNITISSSWVSTENVELTVGNFNVPRYRGIEQPFGDVWTNLDGIIIDANCGPSGRDDNLNIVYTTTDSENFSDSINSSYSVAGHELHQDGWIGEFDLGNNAEIIPIDVTGDSTKKKCDYHYTGSKDTTLRTLLVGGNASYGTIAGLAFFRSDLSVGFSDASVGFRTLSLVQ